LANYLPKLRKDCPVSLQSDRVALQLLQGSTLFIVRRQVQIFTLLVSAQPYLAVRPRCPRYRATRSLMVATNALCSLDVGVLTRWNLSSPLLLGEITPSINSVA